MTNRREFITLLCGATAVACPLTTRAQQMWRVILVVSLPEREAEAQARVAAFRDGLAGAGWIEGSNLQLDVRWDISLAAQVDRTVADIIRSPPDVVCVQGSVIAEALRRATQTTPVVFVNLSDPLGSGIVDNLARPGGNMTGFVNFEFSIGTKWLATLKEFSPGLKRALFIMHPENIGQQGMLSAIKEVAPSLKMQIVSAPSHDRAEIERAIDAFAQEPDGGVIVPANNIALRNREVIIERCARYRMPAIYATRAYVTDGGLMSYDTDVADLYQRAAGYVDRILRSEKPGDLPVQAPTKFELAINLKTARALGYDVPMQLLARADEVIE